MHILITNDDGINSPLLHALCRAAAARGHQITVSAPATQQSAKSHAFTITEPVHVSPASVEGAAAAWAVHGTPVDSCRIGLMALTNTPVDLVISGVNNGYNAGLAVFVSGTVGAAREAAFMNKPAMALSLQPGTPDETIAFFVDYAIRLGERLITYPAPRQSVCNVNVPPVLPAKLNPPTVCPINRNIYKDNYQCTVSPRSQRYYWLEPEAVDDAPDPGSDIDLLHKGHLTITFLSPDGCGTQGCENFPIPY